MNSLARELRTLKANEKRIDQAANEIRISNLIAGCADDQRTYRIVREHLIFMRAEEHEAREDSRRETTKKRITGKLKLISKRGFSREAIAEQVLVSHAETV